LKLIGEYGVYIVWSRWKGVDLVGLSPLWTKDTIFSFMLPISSIYFQNVCWCVGKKKLKIFPIFHSLSWAKQKKEKKNHGFICL
jgi:hypothetical protein